MHDQKNTERHHPAQPQSVLCSTRWHLVSITSVPDCGTTNINSFYFSFIHNNDNFIVQLQRGKALCVIVSLSLAPPVGWK